MADSGSKQTENGTKVPAYFLEALEDSERLLKYAAEMGIAVDADTRSSVLHARTIYPDGWTEDVAAKLLLALTALAANIKPVTAASLQASGSGTRTTMRTYLVWAIVLAVVIVPASVLTFVTSHLSDEISGEVSTANALAVKLNSEVSAPARADFSLTQVTTDLQDYADKIRSIYDQAASLNWCILPRVQVPAGLPAPKSGRGIQLEVPITNENALTQSVTMTEYYQNVRFFAQTDVSDAALLYGAINSCILPILYALLGTCAYLLRTFEDQMSNRTFVPSAANSARFLIAGIGGAVVGLFHGFTSQASASPLAIAFLVGYAVEVFFAFLEGIIKPFAKGVPTSSSTQSATP
jgi:hypothetical protein